MFDLNLLRMGYFAVYKNEGGFVGNAIERHQRKIGFAEDRAKYIHIDVLGGGPHVVRVNPPKTKVVDIRKVYPGRHVKIVKFCDERYDAGKRYKVAFWAATHCNLAYDFLGILKFKLGRFMFHKKSLFFCSENALWVLQKEFPEVLGGLVPYKCMPADFLDEEYFEVVWEGNIPGGTKKSKVKPMLTTPFGYPVKGVGISGEF